MKKLRSALVVGAMAVALGGMAAPAASADSLTQATEQGGISIQRTWHAEVQCQIKRISDDHVVGYDRGTGSGNSKDAAIKDAKRNVPVPPGHYKRHCDTKRIW
ncbi:hypothetical protein ACWCXB_22625 [Streptomyces sp. NPDC001514]